MALTHPPKTVWTSNLGHPKSDQPPGAYPPSPTVSCWRLCVPRRPIAGGRRTRRNDALDSNQRRGTWSKHVGEGLGGVITVWYTAGCRGDSMGWIYGGAVTSASNYHGPTPPPPPPRDYIRRIQVLGDPCDHRRPTAGIAGSELPGGCSGNTILCLSFCGRSIPRTELLSMEDEKAATPAFIWFQAQGYAMIGYNWPVGASQRDFWPTNIGLTTTQIGWSHVAVAEWTEARGEGI